MLSPIKQAADRQELEVDWGRYYDDPVAFAYEIVLIEKLDKWQEETLMALARQTHVAVAAGTGVGKEVVASISVFWFLLTRAKSKVACLSASAQQVQVALWMELKKWIDNSPILQHYLEWTPSTIQVKGYGESWRAFQSVAAKRISQVTGEAQAEGGAGIHADSLLIVVSEASGVDDAQWDAKLATLTGGDDNRILAIGNPVRRSGRFYEIFTRPAMKKHWWTRNVDQRESSFVSKAHIQLMIDTHGENSAIVQSKVYGQFPLLADGKTVFGWQEVEECFERNIEDDPMLPLQLGVDVGRYGDNETVIFTRRGRFCLGYEKWAKTDVMDTVGYAVVIATKWWQRPLDNPRTSPLTPDEFRACQKDVLICVDEVGVGGGVVDVLRKQGWRVAAINNGSKARNPRHYKSRGDEIWMVDGKIALSECYIPRDEELQHQLCNREVRYDGIKRRLETKDEMARRGLASPDRADALLLAFAATTSQESLDYRQAIVFT